MNEPKKYSEEQLKEIISKLEELKVPVTKFKSKKGYVKKVLIFFGCILVILVLTNPTMKDIREYTGSTNKTYRIVKESNYLIFSIYTTKKIHEYDNIENRYLGIMKNFYLTSSKQYSDPNYYDDY